MRTGHSLEKIGNYSLSQFTMFLHAEAELESAQRVNFVSDMAVVVGSLFSKDSPLAEHVFSLQEASVGVVNGN